MFKPMLVSGLTLDPLTNSPIVILKEIDGDRTLPMDRLARGHCDCQ